MKTHVILLSACSLFLAGLFFPADSIASTQKGQSTPSPLQLQLNWNDTKQVIDGFGIAQAGWADQLYAHHKREEVMEMMFGRKGLQLNILRGEVFPHYWENETDKDFNLNDDINLPLCDSFFTVKSDDLIRRGQLWITRNAKEVHHIDKLLFSTWSPPAYMKSNGKVSKGFLKPEYYQDFADYLAKFCQAYASIGLEVYAISPSNEPGYEAEWNSCKWNAAQMGTFITENLGPALKQNGVKADVVFGENPFWSTPKDSPIAVVSSEKFVDDIIDAHPDINTIARIASGHGYTAPDNTPVPVEIVTAIVPYTKAEAKGLKVWVTEISTTDPLDTSMKDGLKWAETFHAYLTTANVNAFIWWAGAMPTTNNESLIVLNPDRNGYSLTKRYDTFGNYTRYIKEGSTRIEVVKGNGIPSEVLISAYKNGNGFVIVAVNPTEKQTSCELILNGARCNSPVQMYLTDKDNQWKASEATGIKGKKLLVLPAQSVVTFTGNVK